MKCMGSGKKIEETHGGGGVEFFFTCLCFTTLCMHGCALRYNRPLLFMRSFGLESMAFNSILIFIGSGAKSPRIQLAEKTKQKIKYPIYVHPCLLACHIPSVYDDIRRTMVWSSNRTTDPLISGKTHKK